MSLHFAVVFWDMISIFVEKKQKCFRRPPWNPLWSLACSLFLLEEQYGGQFRSVSRAVYVTQRISSTRKKPLESLLRREWRRIFADVLLAVFLINSQLCTGKVLRACELVIGWTFWHFRCNIRGEIKNWLSKTEQFARWQRRQWAHAFFVTFWTWVA